MKMSKRKSSALTANEKHLMDVLWESDKPLLCSELQERTKELGWNDTYILNMIRSLRKKDMVKISGIVRISTQSARQFEAAVTKQEYAAQLALGTGIQDAAIGKTALALVRAMDVDEGVLKELEDIIESLEKRSEDE